jgi:hypothetical protein
MTEFNMIDPNNFENFNRSVNLENQSVFQPNFGYQHGDDPAGRNNDEQLETQSTIYTSPGNV